MTKGRRSIWDPRPPSEDEPISVYGYEKPTLVRVDVTCPKCGEERTYEVEKGRIEGGCSGHSEGDYCYCDARHWDVQIRCGDCNQLLGVQVDV